jgi:hypothetical protein
MDNKSLKVIGTVGILIGTAYVIGKHIWEIKNEPIAIFKYTAGTGKMQRLK